MRVAGVGLLRGETNMKQSFNVYTREAGRGELEVSVEGPSEAELQFHDHKVYNAYDLNMFCPRLFFHNILMNSGSYE